MANDLHPGKKIYPAHRDPIRIVPLHLPDSVPQPTAEAAAAGPAPQGMRSHLNIHYLFFGLQHSSCNCAVSVQPLLQMPQSRGHAAALADSSSPQGFSHPHPGAGAGGVIPINVSSLVLPWYQVPGMKTRSGRATGSF
jgi:hypothetical protein